jgi:DNA-binding CsgD family transcriptional regulator
VQGQGGGRHTAGDLIGRDRELGVLRESLERAQTEACAVVFEGEPGIGKTAVWRRGVQEARDRGLRLLTSAPTGSEARLAYAALGDLLDPVLDEVAAELAAPQRVALERALLRRSPGAGRALVDERTIGVATLSALRGLAAGGPLLVAIDDLQWVDPASAVALRFALRRLAAEPILVLATRRVQPSAPGERELHRILTDERVQCLTLEPLSVGAIHEVLVSRLSVHMPRPVLLRLHELTRGNAFFALEIARELAARRITPAPGDPLPVPGSVRELVQTRFARLSPSTRRVLLAASALARPSRAQLQAVDDAADTAIAQAIEAGLIEIVGERVRFTHPLFASILYEQAPLAQRRAIHARLSELVADLEERARHLALATSGVDDGVAQELDEAVHGAGRRGAPQAAAELCDLAARLTSDPARRAARVLASAEHHRQAGNLALATDRAREVVEGAREPELRARALAVLGAVTTDGEGVEAGMAFYRRARRERGSPPSVRCDVHHKLAWMALVEADARRAERHAYAMTRLSDPRDPAAVASAEATLSHAIVARGRPVPRERLARAVALEARARGDRPWVWSETGPTVLEGVVLLWGGELEEAAVPLQRILEEAVGGGHLWLEMMALAYLSAIETGLGRPRRGLELAQRYLEMAEMVGQDGHRAGALWPLAVAAGWLGHTERATAAAQESLAIAQRTGHGLYVIGNLSVLGAIELSLGHAAQAADTLSRAWARARAGGIASPARFPVLADGVEALAAVGELQRAAELAAEHDRISRTLNRPWALALAARCAGVLADARGDQTRADEAFAQALAQHALQDRPLDHARTLLAYGASARRARRKSAAREALQGALDIFEAAGAGVWAQRARAELQRIGGRSASPEGELSATESAIAERVAAGQTNREVGLALHMSARTVEWNLSRVYRKLGVRSRTELARALSAAGPGKSRDFTG